MGDQKLSEEQIAELKQVSQTVRFLETSFSVIHVFCVSVCCCPMHKKTQILLLRFLDSDSDFQAFNEFDVDGGGNISTKELGWAMRAMGMNPTENALLELINEVGI